MSTLLATRLTLDELAPLVPPIARAILLYKDMRYLAVNVEDLLGLFTDRSKDIVWLSSLKLVTMFRTLIILPLS